MEKFNKAGIFAGAKMNKRGESEFSLMYVYIPYLVILAAFMILLYFSIGHYLSGAAVSEDYYAKEIVKVINLAEPGDVIELNVHKGTEIALKNKVTAYSDLFRIDNKNKEVCVRFFEQGRTCYSFFNDVFIDNWRLELGIPENVLYFEVKERVKK